MGKRCTTKILEKLTLYWILIETPEYILDFIEFCIIYNSYVLNFKIFNIILKVTLKAHSLMNSNKATLE